MKIGSEGQMARGQWGISAKLFLRQGTVAGLLKKMNIEHRTFNIEF
jgi:hypothetical protein